MSASRKIQLHLWMRLLKSKYSDLIILSTVILVFLILIIISATLT